MAKYRNGFKTKCKIVLLWLNELLQRTTDKDDVYTINCTINLLKEIMESKTEQETTPIYTDDGHICCDACGCEIKAGQGICENCRREINWEK